MAKRAALKLKLEDLKAKKTEGETLATKTASEASGDQQRKGQTLRLPVAAWRQLKYLSIDRSKPAHDLLVEARRLTHAPDFYGFVFPGRDSGLFGTFFELVEAAGASLFPPDLVPQIENEGGRWALNFLRTSERDMYESWTPSHFEGPYTQRWITGVPLITSYDVPAAAVANRGATLAVWNDDPTAAGAQPAAVAAGITPRLRILAQKTWGSPPLTMSYTTFAKIPG